MATDPCIHRPKYNECWHDARPPPRQLSTITNRSAACTIRSPCRTSAVLPTYLAVVSTIHVLYGRDDLPRPQKQTLRHLLDKFQKNTVRRERYLLHFLGTLTLSLLVVNAFILFWPTPELDFSGATFDTRGQEVIQIEEIQQTTQEKRKPPPPVPQPPVVMPDDVVLDDIELEIADVALDINEAGTEDENVEGADTGNNPVAARADRSPSPVRIATPEYPRDADRRNIRAEIVVEVLVSDRGRVIETRIVERYLLSKDGTEKEMVARIGYGMEEAAIAAAERHTFRPAIQAGQRVQSYSTLTFRVGLDR